MNPYKRIIRPLHQGHFGHDHLIDNRYCAERQQLIHAYHMIENDFIKLIDYVELHDNNKTTFSHRIYELLLRTCTEFENNCTGILTDNGFHKSGNLNITDYFKINEASKLNEYEVRLNILSPQVRRIQPFLDWNATTFTSLSWYQSYNEAKHDRSLNFYKASLETLVQAISGLFVILASQFYHQVFSAYQVNVMTYVDDDKFSSANDSIFSIKFPQSWQPNDLTPIDWNVLKATPSPFTQYNFN